MVRGPKQRRPGARGPRRADDGASDEAAEAQAKPRAPTGGPMKTWLDEHWHGWVKQVSILIVLAIGYVLYSQRLIPEGVAGPIVIVAIIGGAIALAALPAWQALDKQRDKTLFGIFVAVWAVSAGYPTLQAALPRAVLAEGHLSKEHLLDKITLPAGENGPYLIAVGGALRGSGEVEAAYRVTVTSTDNKTGEEIAGSLKREIVRVAAGRRGGGGGTRAQEHTEVMHRVTSLRGPELSISADSVDDTLEAGLVVSVRRAGIDPRIFLGLAALCVLIALLWDYRLYSPTVKTSLTMAAAFLAVFAYVYPNEATPRFLVPPAVSAFVVAILTGGLGGALLGWIVRQFKPLPKKVKGAGAKAPAAR